jgi:hypothetical protein
VIDVEVEAAAAIAIAVVPLVVVTDAEVECRVRAEEVLAVETRGSTELEAETKLAVRRVVRTTAAERSLPARFRVVGRHRHEQGQSH